MSTLRGVIHGNTIQLSENPGLPDGLEVEIVMRPKRLPGEGLRRCAGALTNSWTEEDDRILEEIERSRSLAATRDVEE